MEVMKIGVMSKKDYIKRTIAIAKGEIKPKKNEPKIWFESLSSVAQVLSNENQILLKIIAESKPESISELETLSHRSKGNLSRTLKTMSKYGLVELEESKGRKKKPKVKATDFELSFGVHSFANSSNYDSVNCA